MNDSRNAFSVRLRSCILKRGDIKKLSLEINVDTASIHRWLDAKTDPKRGNLIALSRALKVRIGWLATGEEPKCLEEKLSPQHLVERNALIKIPRYNAMLSAGPGAFNQGDDITEYFGFSVEFFQQNIKRESEEGLLLVDVKGDSMEPTISDGDMVLVDHNANYISDGILAFIKGETAHVKRIQETMNGINIISDNPNYESYLIPVDKLEQIHIIGKVIWAGRSF